MRGVRANVEPRQSVRVADWHAWSVCQCGIEAIGELLDRVGYGFGVRGTPHVQKWAFTRG